MRKSGRLLKFALSFFLLGASAHGQNWNVSDAPGLGWKSLAGSLDGTKLVAAAVYYDASSGLPGLIYTSTNGGQNWNLTSAPSNYWYSVASSADGVRLVAGANGDPGPGYPGPICLSSNGGSIWVTSSAPFAVWQAVASSTNGEILVGNAYNDGIYISTNFGANWNLATNNVPTNNAWISLAVSADGHKIYATFNGGIYVSTNTGATWTNTAPTADTWWPVACSQDGRTVFAGIYGGTLYASTNSGSTWGLNFNQNWNWQCLAMSTNGSTVFAGNDAALWLSTDGGANWNQQNTSAILPLPADWYCNYCSANGGSLVAGALGDYIYLAVPTPIPTLHIQAMASHAIISWPASATANGFQLKTIGVLRPAATWTNITAGITQIGTNNVYTNSLTAPAAFFRLEK